MKKLPESNLSSRLLAIGRRSPHVPASPRELMQSRPTGAVYNGPAGIKQHPVRSAAHGRVSIREKVFEVGLKKTKGCNNLKYV